MQKQLASDHEQRQVVVARPVSSHAALQHVGRHQRRDAGSRVDGQAASEVHHAPSHQKTVGAPDPVRNGVVDKNWPERHKHEEGLELHALRPRPRDDDRDHHSKHHLERHKEQGRDRRRVSKAALQADS